METHTQTRSIECRLSLDYLRTVPGILKIVELVLSIIAFGCAAHVADTCCHHSGYGWVSFVTISGFVQALVSLILHILFNTTWTWSYMLELILYAIWTVLLFIAGVVAAALAHGNSTAGAAAAFTFFSMAAWAIDAALMFKNTRITFSSSTTTTTATTTASAPKSNPDPSNRFEGNPQY